MADRKDEFIKSALHPKQPPLLVVLVLINTLVYPLINEDGPEANRNYHLTLYFIVREDGEVS